MGMLTRQATFVKKRPISSSAIAIVLLRTLLEEWKENCMAILVMLRRKCHVYGLQLGILPVMKMREEEKEHKTCHPWKDQIRILRPKKCNQETPGPQCKRQTTKQPLSVPMPGKY